MVNSYSAHVVDSIQAHAVSVYPNEACGALVGRLDATGDVEVSDAVAIENVSPDRKADRFLLDAQAYVALERRLREQGEHVVVGFFHSHPDGKAVPSNIDLEMASGLYEFARTRYVYAIQAVDANGCGEIKFWQLAPDAGAFIEMPARARPSPHR